jgi:hypothetical protein
MKTTLLLSALLGVAALSHAQTAPSTSTGTAAPVTGPRSAVDYPYFYFEQKIGC